MPMKSKDSEGLGRSFGSTMAAYAMATTPIGALIRKIQCQLNDSIIQPPRIGPPMGPSSMGTPSTAMSRPIRAGPAARVMMVIANGMSMPPPRPCRTRYAMSWLTESAVAHNTDPNTNNTSAAM